MSVGISRSDTSAKVWPRDHFFHPDPAVGAATSPSRIRAVGAQVDRLRDVSIFIVETVRAVN
jgi:hypothetical protein